MPGIAAVSVEAITQTKSGRLPRRHETNDLPRSG